MKYLEDPFKKVSYSFRIEERLLEDIKKYANGSGKKLPETFNYLLKKSLEGVNVSNTYLKEYEGALINITFMEHQKHYTYGVDDEITDTWYSYTRGVTDYTNFNFEGLLYEVKQIPSNLDKWYNDTGYISSNEFLHEGVCLLIVPELILHDKVCITGESITNCLKFIYFSIDINNRLEIRSISYKDCFRRLKAAGNDTDLIKFKKIDGIIYNYSIETIKEIEEVTDDPQEYRNIIYYDLMGFAANYNDGNIISIDDKTKKDMEITKIIVNDEDIEKLKPESTSNDYQKEIDKLKKELEAKNQEITQYEEMTKDLENTINDIDSRLKELESKE